MYLLCDHRYAFYFCHHQKHLNQWGFKFFDGSHLITNNRITNNFFQKNVQKVVRSWPYLFVGIGYIIPTIRENISWWIIYIDNEYVMQTFEGIIVD